METRCSYLRSQALQPLEIGLLHALTSPLLLWTTKELSYLEDMFQDDEGLMISTSLIFRVW